MSRHDGVSCDTCLTSNFAGERFKCLRCYDFDLCRECHENRRGAGSAASGGDEIVHTTDHPVQCVMTREDFDFAHSGEAVSANDLRALSFTCPYCGRLGFSQPDLYQHVSTQHLDTMGIDVICPICVVSPTADPNRMLDDLATHIGTEHIARQDRSAPSGTHDQQPSESRLTRRIHGQAATSQGFSAGGAAAGLFNRGRGRQRSWQTQQNGTGGRTGAATTAAAVAHVASSAQNSIDSISELLSQLGGIRRSSNNYSATLAQIQQLQQQFGRRSNTAPRRVEDSDFRAEEEALRAAVIDPGVADLWSELAANHPSQAAAVLESVQGRGGGFHATRGSGLLDGQYQPLPPTTVILKPPSGGPPRSAAPLATTSAGGGLSCVSERETGLLLAPKLFETSLKDEERAAKEEFARNRSEFVSQIFVDLCLTETETGNDDELLDDLTASETT